MAPAMKSRELTGVSKNSLGTEESTMPITKKQKSVKASELRSGVSKNTALTLGGTMPVTMTKITINTSSSKMGDRTIEKPLKTKSSSFTAETNEKIDALLVNSEKV